MATLNEEAMIPVALNGQNYRISLKTVMDAFPRSAALFSEIRNDASAVIANGATALDLPVVWDRGRNRFYAMYENGGTVTYYTEWSTSAMFVDGSLVRENVLYVCVGDLGMYIFTNGSLAQLTGGGSLNSMQLVTEDELAAMKANGTIVKGGVYCTAE